MREKPTKSEKLKKALQVIISAIIGWKVVHLLELTTFFSVLFFLGIYIVVSLIIEMIWRLIYKVRRKNK